MAKRDNRKKIFNSLNIILIALVLIEVAFVVNEGVLTGQPVRSATMDVAGNAQVNNIEGGEVEEPKFNGYIVQLQDEPVSKIYLEEKSKVDKGLSTKQALKEKTDSHRKNLVDKQNALETNIKNLYPKAKIDSKVQNVFNGFAVFGISEEEVEKIKSLPEVKSVSPNYKVHTTLMDSVPLIGADQVWDIQVNGTNLTGERVTIGIIDSGVDYMHPDLGGCFGSGCKVVGGWDFIKCARFFNNGTCKEPKPEDSDPMDDFGHGTAIAGVVAGNGTVLGVAPSASIYAYKILDYTGNGVLSDVLSALERATDPNLDNDLIDHLDIISVSIGAPPGSEDDEPAQQAVNNLVDVGVVAVVGAGNSGPRGTPDCRHEMDLTGNSYSICSPGTARNAITVAASDKNNIIADFSSRGPTIDGRSKPDITAPGFSICTTRAISFFPHELFNSLCVDEQHSLGYGTSIATPHVAGAVALIKQAHPDWTPYQIKEAIMSTTVDIGEDVYTQGAGRIDVLSTIKLNCADLNSDGARNILDVTLLINTAFRNGPEPQPKWIGDLNADGVIDIFDVVSMINHVFRNGPEPTCTAESSQTSSSGTMSLGSVSGTTTKTIPVNLANSEAVAGTTFKISYDATKLGTLKNFRTGTRTNGIDVIRNGNTITLMEQDGSLNIAKGTGIILYIDFTPPKTGFSSTSLKITEVKAANPQAKNVAVSIGKTSVPVVVKPKTTVEGKVSLS